MKVICRQCRVDLTPINQHSHGFCIGCTDGRVSTAIMLDEQYSRIDQDTGRRTWELLSSLSDEIHAVRTEMRILFEALGLIEVKLKKRKGKKAKS